MTTIVQTIASPLTKNNPITVQLLGICSALAVTTHMTNALTMSIAVTAVMVISSAIISVIRNHLPSVVRLIIQITIISSLVIVIDQILQAYFYEISQVLSVFVSLIVTNCLVLGRTEGFASHNKVVDSVADALGNALGYSLVLLTVAFLRELLGFGSLFGYSVFSTVADGGWYNPMTVMQKAPSAFFIIGVLIWVKSSLRSSPAPQTTPPQGIDHE